MVGSARIRPPIWPKVIHLLLLSPSLNSHAPQHHLNPPADSSPPKDTLGKSKITGNKQVDGLQDGVNEGVGGQLGKGGLLNPVGEGVSDQGITRAEKGDTGPLSTEEAQKQQKGYLGGATDAVKGAGSSIGGWLPGGGAK